MPIRFFCEGIDFTIRNPRKTANWIKESAKKEKRLTSEINYIFCSNRYLLNLNQNFLSHTTLTDIITFDYSEGRLISGDIYISLEMVKENSSKYNSLFEEELRRVMIHGVLHLSGYEDKKTSEKALMRKKEEAYLSLWKRMFHVKR